MRVQAVVAEAAFVDVAEEARDVLVRYAEVVDAALRTGEQSARAGTSAPQIDAPAIVLIVALLGLRLRDPLAGREWSPGTRKVH